MSHPTLLERLLANRDERVAKRDAILGAVEARGDTTLTADEDTEFRGIVDELRQIDEQVPVLREQMLADQAADAARRQLGVIAPGLVRVKSEPLTYRRGGEHSWFRDMARAQDKGTSDERALERLMQHRKELDTLAAQGGLEARTNMSRTDGQGGEFVPPLWLLDQYVPLARAGRITADLCRRFPLPVGTDTVTLPKVATGATTATVADGSAPSNTDMTTSSTSGAVTTIAGQQRIAMQLLDQSPVAFDEVIFADLLASHAVSLDQQVLYGTGSAPEVRGITQVASINTTTYTDSTATMAEIYPKLAKAIADVGINRYLPAQAIVMHPRRWAWMLGQLDGSSRPFVVSNNRGPQNAFAGLNDVRAEGAVGEILGLPVYVDPNVPTNLGSGTDEDIIIVARFDDLFLYEGALRTRTLFETDANTLQVRFQLWSYATFIGGRYPKSISTLGGTGLNAVLS